MPRLVAFPPARAPGADRAARVGLVLSVLLALVGVVSAVGRSGDTTTTANAGASAVHEPDARSTTTTVPPAVAPAGFHLVTGPDISLAVPDGWTTMDPADLHLSVADLRRIYPEMDTDILRAATAAVDEGAIFMAVDMAGEGRGRNVNVLTVPVELPLDQMGEVVRGLEANGLGVKETGPIDHPLGKAFQVSYAMTVGGQPIEGVLVYLPVKGMTYVMTVTAAPPALAEQIIQSLRVDHSVTT
jgi:hypothetical protein